MYCLDSINRHVPDVMHRRKPMVVALQNAEKLCPHYHLSDLLLLGIGATVGTGLFSLAGYIASDQAGPSVIICWGIAGFACILNGFSYMELTLRLPCPGSTYAFCYVALGEFPALIAGWCLALEYGVSGAAVARSWSNKVYLGHLDTCTHSNHSNYFLLKGV